MVQIKPTQKLFMKAQMASILSFQKMMVFGVGVFTSQRMLNILVEILNGKVTPINFPMTTNYLMEAHYQMVQK